MILQTTTWHTSVIEFMFFSAQKLRKIQDSIEVRYKDCSSLSPSNFLNVFKPRNLEKLSDKYGYGQLSIRYFLITTVMMKVPDDVSVLEKRRKLIEENGLDLNSCLQFLLDYYTQLMRPQVSNKVLNSLDLTILGIF